MLAGWLARLVVGAFRHPTHADPGRVAAAQHAMPEMIRAAFLGRFGKRGEPRFTQRLVPADGDPSRCLAG